MKQDISGEFARLSPRFMLLPKTPLTEVHVVAELVAAAEFGVDQRVAEAEGR